jgi:UDP-N-acetylmuramoyl-tripeptide--D-alanyl-D-alanine ligase
VLAALEAMQDIAAGRHMVAVLGEMAELGDEAAAWHDRVGQAAAKTGIAHLVLVGGDHAEALGTLARTVDIDVHTAPNGQPLAPFVGQLLEPHDVVLVKGANALGLEAVARELIKL